jgi:putative ABC transport system substrate-binding protein
VISFHASAAISASGGACGGGNWRAAGYLDRILKGEKPADQPDQFRAGGKPPDRKGGLTVPPSLLARADEVIE